jgi:hypothetical protein
MAFTANVVTAKSGVGDLADGYWKSWAWFGAAVAALTSAIILFFRFRSKLHRVFSVGLFLLLVLEIVSNAILLVLFVATLASCGLRFCPPPAQAVRLAVGSENAPFFQDSRVRAVFLANGLNVEVTPFGGLQMCGIDFTKYDAVVPSGQIAAQQVESCAGKLTNQPEAPLFRSPLAIATYLPIAQCLQSLGIAKLDSHGFWQFLVWKYIQAVRDRLSWSQCGTLVSPLTGRIVVSTTSPRCSNSSEMFLADASYVANGRQAVADPNTARHVGTELAPLIGEQGFMEVTTDVLFHDYLIQGMTYTPMALIYEAEFIGEEITHPGHIKHDMVLMYPTPDVFSQRVLIPVQGQKDRSTAMVGDLLNEPSLAQLAQEAYGFRYSDASEFQKVIGSHWIFGKRITAPGDFQPGRPPQPDILKDLVNAAMPFSTDNTASASANSAPVC